MRVAFDAYPIAGEKLSGIGYHALHLTKILCEKYRDIDPVLLLYDFLKRHKSNQVLQDRLGFDKILERNCLPFGIYVELWKALPALTLDRLFCVEADIYHFFNFVVPPLKKGKVVNTVHDLVYYYYPETMEKRNYRRLKNHLQDSVKRSDIILTVSNAVKREIVQELDVLPDQVRVVHNGVDYDRFSKEIPSCEIERFKAENHLPKHYFLYLGTLEPRKNVPLIIKAFAMGKDKMDGCKLVIAGHKGWEFTEIFELVKQYKLEKDIVFPGYVSDIPKIMKGAEGFVFPSLYEGFGMPPLEAMAAGVPVITSDIPSLSEVVGDAAIKIGVQEAEALSEAMLTLLTDSALRQQLIIKGWERAKSFTWEQSADMIYQIYRELI